MLNQAATVAVSVTVILGFLAIVAVGLRVYCRLSQKISLGADTYCVLVALFISTGVAILTDYVACTTGVGDQSYQPSIESVVFGLKTNLALENFQIAGMALVKISLLLYYSRIFILRPILIAANVLIAITSVFALSIILVNIFDKWPVSEQWNPLAPYTVNVSALLISFCAGNAVLDVLTLVLPLLTIRNLQMNAGRKLVLSVIFSLGSITVVVTFLRLYYAVEYTKKPETGNSFFEVPFIYNILMALIELPVFIIANSMLTFGPLLRSKYGPGSLFRSLRSRLLQNRSKSTGLREDNGKVSNGSSVPSTESQRGDGRWHPWSRINEPTPTSSHVNLRDSEWEMSGMNTHGDHRRDDEVV
ncbi:uncharacterized protein F4822DRAFT_418099 [Hypoxylon trugodes]|uniref:uncharacterized protein n=1 Tax=Hypoxylon trugodes TaxID=326681 RepID=UPI00219E42D8|nr:uncharacterized protein F4822DRAFT_418099 [Hypoxylon trugodes]KAI1383945.1 hypothetical protein F4822DRAFT_418099 [Hypoxylon trugodes]